MCGRRGRTRQGNVRPAEAKRTYHARCRWGSGGPGNKVLQGLSKKKKEEIQYLGHETIY